MHIATLQFNPVFGDVEASIRRADQLLEEADTKGLELLVLPEMAFTGYNFPSLAAIIPHLEPTASGPTATWAARTARRLKCIVSVGYPEIASELSSNLIADCDVGVLGMLSKDWKASDSSDPSTYRNYNSTITVSPTGIVLAHYRKTHLYYTDEIWAVESPSGFMTAELRIPYVYTKEQVEINKTGDVPLTTASFGICMDLNPYQFKADWDAYEFATHAKNVEAGLVVVSTAWLTRLEREELGYEEDESNAANCATNHHKNINSEVGKDPDLATLSYWIERFAPLVLSLPRSTSNERHSPGKESIVVLANRVGIEPGAVEAPSGGLVCEEARYAGTSCVLGMDGRGRIKVYGILGRAEEKLLRVDTDAKPEMVFAVRNLAKDDNEDEEEEENIRDEHAD